MKLQQKQFFFTISRDLGPRRMVVKNLACPRLQIPSSVPALISIQNSKSQFPETQSPPFQTAASWKWRTSLRLVELTTGLMLECLDTWVLICLFLFHCISLKVNLDVSGSSKVTVLFPIILFIPPVNIQPQNQF